jgi:hypothetical protein
MSLTTWSCVLAGLTALLTMMATHFPLLGVRLNVVLQGVWIFYAIQTSQWGFIVLAIGSVFTSLIQYRIIKRHRRFHALLKDGDVQFVTNRQGGPGMDAAGTGGDHSTC